MKTSLLLTVAALVSAVIACGGSESDDGSGSEAEVKAGAPTAAQIHALFDKIDGNCAGNDNGGIRTFDVAKLDAAAVMSRIKAGDKDAMGSDCSKERIYSTSKEDAVKMFRDHVNDKAEDTKECLASNLSEPERKMLDAIVSDPKNVAVFANSHGGGDNPEACTYYNFEIYRPDGMLIELRFNFTD